MQTSLFQTYKEEKKRYLNFLKSFRHDFFVWSEGWSAWLRLSEIGDATILNKLELHREVLPPEWVFDMDAENWEECRELAIKLEERLNDWHIPFNRWSSGRWLHFHVFLDDNWLKKKEVEQKANMKWYRLLIETHFDALKKEEYTINDVRELMVQIHRAIPLLILKGFPQSENAKIDPLKFKSTKVLIRMEGTRNEKTGAFKSFLSELPKEQPLIKASWHVRFPSEVSVWRPNPEEYHKLFIIAWEKFVKPQSLKHIKIFKGKHTNEIAWIEKILNTTFTDGRKRLIELVILPYLINHKNIPPDEAVNIAYDWALKNHSIAPITRNKRSFGTTALLNYIRYHAKRCQQTKLKPLSLKGVEKWFADTPEVLDYVLGKNEQ